MNRELRQDDVVDDDDDIAIEDPGDDFALASDDEVEPADRRRDPLRKP